MRIIHLSVRLIIIGIALLLTFQVLKEKTDVLSLVSMFYFANLLLNIVFAFFQTKRSILFPIGLLLFACCDALIGLSLLEEQYLDLPDDSFIHQINESSGNTAWMFYVPSQTLISLSLTKNKLQRSK